ncbi:Vms1/Ankzf1 family peptidyl-tRNA hydrolase [Microlunatus sp. GCM10028923]|uniref:baeRF2 domain-containing protein n=1 Tax=Microlunatus sp. GCM10028923 TaxID=3273400 RepID=UPI00360731CB
MTAPAAYPARLWAELFRRPGPWCSVFYDAGTGTVDSRHAQDVVPDQVADELRRQGADDATLTAIVEAVRPATGESRPAARLILAESGEVRLDEVLVGSEAGPGSATVGPVPDLLPLLRHDQHRFPYLVVVVGRDGGEVRRHTAHGVRQEPITVTGSRENLTKNPRGGWSQGHYQHRTEEIWRRNTGALADAVEEARRIDGARLIAVIGDSHAAQLLITQLPPAAADLTARIDTIPDGSEDDDALQAGLDELIAEQYGRAEQALLEQLSETGGRQRRGGVTGIEPVAAALQRAQADVVVLTDEPAEDRLDVLDAEPWVATRGGETYGAGILGEAEARGALLRAAALSDADVVLLPPGALRSVLADGAEAAALLRWTAEPG